MGEDWSVRLGGPKPALLAGKDVISLRRDGRPLPPYPAGEQLVLANGDRLPLQEKAPLRIADELASVRLQPPLRPERGEDFRLSQARVAVLWLAAPAGTDDPPRLLRRLLTEPRQGDRVFLRDGDLIEGTVLAFDRSGDCRIQMGQKEQTVPAGRVAVIAFETALLARARPKAPQGHLVAGNGCRLSLASARLEDDGRTLVGKTAYAASVRLPLAEVVALDVWQGRAVYLSDLKPAGYTHSPFLGVSWPFTADASAAGRELCLADGTHDRGIGMHADSTLTYDLAGKFSRFEAVVGLNQQTGRRGRVRVEVLLDGRTQNLGNQALLTGRDRPLTLGIDVRGASRLTLAVRPDRFGDVQAHVDWADARLIRVE